MAALSADVNLQHYGTPTKIEVPCIGADIFYKGALVYADATGGKAQVGNLNAGDRFLGICAKQTTTTAADQLVPIYVDGVFGLPMTAASSDAGDSAIMNVGTTFTDNPEDLVTADAATAATDDALIGTILSYHSSRAWVALDPGKVFITAVGFTKA